MDGMTTQPNERIPQWTLGDRLRKARQLTGLGTREFADKIGVSHGTITNAEGGRHGVRKITLNAWSLATGVPVEWLETGHVNNPPGPGGGGNSVTGEYCDYTEQVFANLQRKRETGLTLVLPLRKVDPAAAAA